MQMVMSSTKGVVAIAAHMLAQERRLDFDARVTDYWPEFGAEGKDDVLVRWLSATARAWPRSTAR